MAAGALRKVQRKFKLRGLTLKVDALEEALSFISPFGDGADEALDLLIDEIHRESVNSSILGRDNILQVVSRMQTADDAVDQPGPVALSVVDVFLVLKFRYDSIRRVFYQHTGGLPIHGEAGDKADMYRDWFQLLQRLHRDPYFSRPDLFDAEMKDSENNSYTVFDWVHGEEVDHGGDITARRRPLLFGRSYRGGANRLVQCNILEK